VVADSDSVGTSEDSPRPEMGEKYTRSRWVAYCLVAATIFSAGFLLFRGDATSAEVEILNIVSGLAMAATVAWMGVSNGREAWVAGRG